MTPLERAARAVLPYLTDKPQDEWTAEETERACKAMEAARAVIMSLEATEQMLDLGSEAHSDGSRTNAAEVFHAMIDAALAESSP